MPSRKAGVEGDGDMFDQAEKAEVDERLRHEGGSNGAMSGRNGTEPEEQIALAPLPADVRSHLQAEDDDWSLADLRIPQDFGADMGGTKLLTTVPVRKPGKQEYVRVRPGSNWRHPAMLLTIAADRESYLVAPHLHEALKKDLQPVELFTAMTRAGTLFIWPVNLPKGTRTPLTWHTSMLEAAQHAETRWVRIYANQDIGAYEIFAAASQMDDPEWPSQTFEEILKIAFKGRYIRDWNHLALRQLRGEV